MQLYTVHYTLAHIVTKYDSRGKPTETYTDDIPHTLHALPHSTAQQYKTCKNFRIEPYQAEPERKSRGDFKFSRLGSKEISATSRGRALRTGKAPLKILEAAATGDLSAAINSEH